MRDPIEIAKEVFKEDGLTIKANKALDSAVKAVGRAQIEAAEEMTNKYMVAYTIAHKNKERDHGETLGTMQVEATSIDEALGLVFNTVHRAEKLKDYYITQYKVDKIS